MKECIGPLPEGDKTLGLVLGDESCTPRVRLGDRGDDVSLLRPKEGRIVNWAMSHDMENYINHLRDIAGYDESFSV